MESTRGNNEILNLLVKLTPSQKYKEIKNNKELKKLYNSDEYGNIWRKKSEVKWHGFGREFNNEELFDNQDHNYKQPGVLGLYSFLTALISAVNPYIAVVGTGIVTGAVYIIPDGDAEEIKKNTPIMDKKIDEPFKASDHEDVAEILQHDIPNFTQEEKASSAELEAEFAKLEDDDEETVLDTSEEDFAELERIAEGEVDSAESKTGERQEREIRKFKKKQEKYKTLKIELNKNWRHGNKEKNDDGSASQSYLILSKTNSVLDNFLNRQDIPTKEVCEKYNALITAITGYIKITKKWVRQKKRKTKLKTLENTKKERKINLNHLAVRSHRLFLKIEGRERSPGGSSKSDTVPVDRNWEMVEDDLQKRKRQLVEKRKMRKKNKTNIKLQRPELDEDLDYIESDREGVYGVNEEEKAERRKGTVNMGQEHFL